MNANIATLIDKMRSLEAELEAELARRRANLRVGFENGNRSSAPGITQLTSEYLKAYEERLSELERHVFGEDFAAAGRTKRWPLGRIAIPREGRNDTFPSHADVYLVTHTTGTAIWEAWVPGPSQPLDALRWIVVA